MHVVSPPPLKRYVGEKQFGVVAYILICDLVFYALICTLPIQSSTWFGDLSSEEATEDMAKAGSLRFYFNMTVALYYSNKSVR